MKIRSFGKSNEQKLIEQWCEVQCDCCSAETLTYQGSPSEAYKKLPGFGWTISATGIVRGKICTQRDRTIAQEALRRTWQ